MSWNIAKPGDQINGPVAVTGNLIVDTNTLVVDAANNRVGIGTATPATALHVFGTGSQALSVERDGATIQSRLEIVSGNSTNLIRATVAKDLLVEQGTGTEVLRIATNGVCTWSNVGGVAGTAMTLNGTGLGIGASPARPLSVIRNNVQVQAEFISSNVNGCSIQLQSTSANGRSFRIGSNYVSGAGEFSIYDDTASAERLRIDASGNLGVGTSSPSGASGKVIEINGAAGQARLVLKNDITGSASTDGSQIALVGSQLVIQNRENSEITFETNGNERVRIDGSGDLAIGRTAAFYPLANRRGLTLHGSAGSIFVLGYNNSPGGYLLADASGTELSEVRAQALRFGTNSTERARITSGGDFRVKGAGTAGSTDAVQFSGSAPASSLLLDSSGNLGLGVTPSAKLEVRTVSNDTIVKSNAVFAFGDFTTLNAGLIGQQSLSSPYQFNLQACDTAGTAYFPLLLQPKGGQVLFGTSGTASAPTFAKFGDTNTGLYFPTGNDTLALAVGGSDAVYIDASRRVGIGTPTPNAGLVISSSGAQGFEFSPNTAGVAQLETYNRSTAAYFSLRINSDDLRICTGSSATERLRIKSTGQIKFIPLGSDPSGAEAGDVYYNSSTNKLRCYNGTTWNDLF